jgi:HSP20 family protein
MALMKLTRHMPRIGFPAMAGTTAFPAFGDVENRMNRYFEQMFNQPFGDGFTETIDWIPPTEIVEMPTELLLTAELPGMDQKNIDISIQDGVLMIRGEKTEEKKEGTEEKKVYLYERTYGSFQRSFTLPSLVDEKLVTAEFDKGVLKVHMPKSAEAKAKGRKVEIKAT